MLTLEDEQVELVRRAVAFWKVRSQAQLDGSEHPAASGASWHCCDYVVSKLDDLLAVLEQYQRDVENGDA